MNFNKKVKCWKCSRRFIKKVKCWKYSRRFIKFFSVWSCGLVTCRFYFFLKIMLTKKKEVSNFSFFPSNFVITKVDEYLWRRKFTLWSYLTCCFSHTSKLSGHFCGLLIQNFAFSETTDTINSNRKLLWWQKNQYYFDVKQRDMVQFFQIISSLVCLVLYSLPNTGKSHIYKSNCLSHYCSVCLFF